jgi:hypothetical protein
MTILTAEARPDLWEDALRAFSDVWPEYNGHGDVSGEYFGVLVPGTRGSMEFPADGHYVVPHGLAPLDVRDGVGHYWEPVVWMLHPVGPS